MTRQISLAHLTAIQLSPPELIRVASRTGFDAVGLRLVAVVPGSPSYPLMDDAPTMRATKAAMAETGLAVADIEFVKITPELDVPGLEAVIAAGAELGARHIITAPYDPDLSRLADRLGALAELSAGYGLSPVLEFFPWTVVADLDAALAVAERSGSDRVGVLVDTLHFDRSGASVERLAAAAPGRLPLIHVCDAPPGRPTLLEEQLHTARAERLAPGDGGIDIAGIVAHMPAGITMALEVPMDEFARRAGHEAVARHAREGLRRALGI